jgi:hypothetical protein
MREATLEKKRNGLVCAALALAVFVNAVPALFAQDEGDAWGKKKSAWLLLSATDRTQAMDFAEDVKRYLDVARSALGSNREVIRRARSAGFTEFTRSR